MTRREQIGDAGVRLVARRGVRALTHRAVDAEAALPPGSTSYYARTRRELTALVMGRLAEGTQADLDGFVVPDRLTTEEAAGLAEVVLDRLARRGDEPAARFALLFEARGDEALHAVLTVDAPVRGPLLATAEDLLRALGVADPAQHAVDAVGLLDALLMHRTARAAPMDTARVIRAYLDGLPKGPAAADH